MGAPIDDRQRKLVEKVLGPLIESDHISRKAVDGVYQSVKENGIGYLVEHLTTQMNVNSEAAAFAVFSAANGRFPMYPEVVADSGDGHTRDEEAPTILEGNTKWMAVRRARGTSFLYFVNPFDARAREDALARYPDVGYGIISRSKLLSLVGLATAQEQVEETEVGYGQEGDDTAEELLDRWLKDAAATYASDIHIEPRERKAIVRMKVDGNLKQYTTLDYPMFHRVSNVLLGRCQSGTPGGYSQIVDDEFTFDVPGRTIKLRVSMAPISIPSQRDEQPNFVLRLLGNNVESINLSSIGLPDTEHNPQLLRMRELAERKHGIILISGPTGSGKTTTGAAFLQELIKEHPDKVIKTVEDPVEIPINGANQVKVNAKAGVTFEAAVRSFLRQDPDVILVGEIRDLAVGSIAIRAALTGHLVLSTIHTNSSVEAVVRLADMGIDRYLIANTLTAVQAQRLVQRLCPHCSTEARWGELLDGTHASLQGRHNDVLRMKYMKARRTYGDLIDFPSDDGFVRIRNEKGCSRCLNGHFGRLVVSELFVVSSRLRRMIIANATASDLREEAAKEGFREMWAHAMSLIAQGATGFAEATAVLEEREEPTVTLASGRVQDSAGESGAKHEIVYRSK